MKIENLRLQINEIHEHLFKLLIKRKNLVDQIWDYKRQQQKNYIDLSREEELIHQFDQSSELINNNNLQNYYQAIVKSILLETRNYQNAQNDLK